MLYLRSLTEISIDNLDHYFTIETPAIAEFKDRGSKFIAYCFPIKKPEDFKAHIQTLKKENPKANHHCFAYRLGIDGNHFRSSDDGEPSGSAGKPILGQIDAKNLTDLMIVVVRYFGGSLLGIPGLINAYKTAASQVLQCTPLVQKTIEIPYELHFNYMEMNDIMRIIKQYNCTIYKNEMQLFCVMQIGIPKKDLAEVISAFEDIKGLEVKQV